MVCLAEEYQIYEHVSVYALDMSHSLNEMKVSSKNIIHKYISNCLCP